MPSALAPRRASSDAPGKRGVVVQGRYGHVSFIIDPAPLRLTVREVVPPYPAKLLDQARRLLDVAEDLPPDRAGRRGRRARATLARTRPVEQLPAAVPRRWSRVEGATTAYLDERPERRDWTLIGCERSQQIHEWFYGERATQVDICPRKVAPAAGRRADQVLPARAAIEVDGRPGRRAVGSHPGPDRRGADAWSREVGAVVGSRLTDSPQYAHLWGTPELAARLRRTGPAAELAGHPRRAGGGAGATRASSRPRRPRRSPTHARADRLDLDLVAEQTRLTVALDARA